VLIDALLWLVSTAIVLVLVTAGVRIGAALVRVRDLGIKKSLGIAITVLAVEVVCVAMVTVGTSQFSELVASVLGVAGVIFGVATPLIVLKLMLRQGWGRTVVVWAMHGFAAILGFAAAGAILSPGNHGARDKAALARTISDIKNSGAAVEASLAGMHSARGSGGMTDATREATWIDVNELSVIESSELRGRVEEPVGSHLRAHIPDKDGWGNPFEYRVELGADDEVIRVCIRSPGRDGVYEGQRYERGGFDRSQYDRDVVWADGRFIRWPE